MDLDPERAAKESLTNRTEEDRALADPFGEGIVAAEGGNQCPVTIRKACAFERSQNEAAVDAFQLAKNRFDLVAISAIGRGGRGSDAGHRRGGWRLT